MKKSNPIMILLIVILVAVLGLGALFLLNNRKKDETSPTVPATPKSNPLEEVIGE